MQVDLAILGRAMTEIPTTGTTVHNVGRIEEYGEQKRHFTLVVAVPRRSIKSMVIMLLQNGASKESFSAEIATAMTPCNRM